MVLGIYGYPSNPSSGSGGGTTYSAGAGLQATTNPDGSVTLSASGGYLTWYYIPEILGSKAIVAGNNVSFSQTATGITINAAATGGGAISTGSYITAISEGALPNSRLATGGSSIVITDAGAGSTATFSVAPAITNADILTWATGDVIFPNRRTLIVGSGLNAQYASNSLTLTATSGNPGTVTSIDLATPNIFTLSGNPITTAGTITIALANQGSGLVWASPTSSTGTPLFRNLVLSDLPSSVGSVQSVGLALPNSTFSISGSPVTATGVLTGTFVTQSSGATLIANPSGGLSTPAWRRLNYLDLPLLSGNNISFSNDGTNLTITAAGSSNTSGTVTSLNVSAPFQTSSGAVTTAGTITLTYQNQAAGTLLIAPSGTTGTPTFRSILGQDLPIFAGNNVSIVTNATGGLVISSTASSGGAGSVTSVGLALPADTFTISNSPVTGTGTLTGTYANQIASTFLAGASSGAPTTPSWRILTRNDLPITPGSNISFTLNSSGGIAINASVSGGGGGTVTSVDSTTPASLFTVSGNPITLSGTLAYALTQAACSLVWAGPASGPNANPTYRSLVAADIPTLPFTKISGTVPVSQGGTNLTATPTNGQLPIGNGTGYTLAGITPGTGIQVANGAGTITVSATGALGGTVTSVAQTVPSIMSVAGSPITGAGTLAIALVNQSSATAFLGPSSGAAGVPSFRAILTSDLPSTVGTVQSVGVSVPAALLTVSGSPVTTSGTVAIALANAASATVFAGPSSGAAAAGAYRALLATDLPSTVVTSAGNLSPLFTSSITNQVLNYAQVTQASSIGFFGPTSGAAANPTFRAMVAGDQPSTTVNSTGNLSPLFTSSISAQALSFAAVNQTQALAFLSPASSTGAPTFRAIGGSDLAAGIVAGSNITITQLPGTNQMSIAGGGGFTASTITANATAAVSTVTFVDLASGNVAVALQTAVGQGGKEIKIKIINNIVPPNTLTINCTATNGAGTIDGSALTITSQYVSDAWTFQSANGSAWYIF